jgi:ATP/maltotriose-dependent transcriptional regulator MalT
LHRDQGGRIDLLNELVEGPLEEPIRTGAAVRSPDDRFRVLEHEDRCDALCPQDRNDPGDSGEVLAVKLVRDEFLTKRPNLDIDGGGNRAASDPPAGEPRRSSERRSLVGALDMHLLIPALGTVLHTTGRVAEATELLDEAVEAARLSGNVEGLGWNLLSRAYVAVAAGDLELALSAAQESVEVTRELDDRLVYTYARWAFASALLETGEAERAVEVLVEAAGGRELPRIPKPWRAHYFELLTRSWLASGRPVEAEETAARAAATAKRAGLEAATALAERAAAAVAIEGGDPVTGAERALAAAAGCDRAGARVDAARARTLAGRALAAAGEQDRALAELDMAARELRACGARRYREEAEHEMRKLGRRFRRRTRARKPNRKGVEALTERELEVARLVVDRRTNPEIASALFLSEKTVETHMRNIFRKLDVSSRADVARTVERAEAAPRPS